MAVERRKALAHLVCLGHRQIGVLGGRFQPVQVASRRGCDFFGQAEEGRYSLYPDKLQKIEFLR